MKMQPTEHLVPAGESDLLQLEAIPLVEGCETLPCAELLAAVVTGVATLSQLGSQQRMVVLTHLLHSRLITPFMWLSTIL